MSGSLHLVCQMDNFKHQELDHKESKSFLILSHIKSHREHSCISYMLAQCVNHWCQFLFQDLQSHLEILVIKVILLVMKCGKEEKSIKCDKETERSSVPMPSALESLVFSTQDVPFLKEKPLFSSQLGLLTSKMMGWTTVHR